MVRSLRALRSSPVPLALAALAAPIAVKAAGNLVMYCGVQEEWCRAVSAAFERETGISVAMTRKSAGEVYAQVKAGGRPIRRATSGGAVRGTPISRPPMKG